VSGQRVGAVPDGDGGEAARLKGGGAMRDEFERRIHTAAIAGWWTLLIATGVLLVQWIAYLIIVPAEPAWVLSLWGSGADWPHVRAYWFWFLAGFKAFIALCAILPLWLTMWARQLRRQKPGP
jgi:hypothetical protein